MDASRFQIFVDAPDLNIRTSTLHPNPNHTIRHLKSSLFPQTLPSSCFLTLHGKPLRDDATVSASGVAPFSTLTLRVRALGGGGDGGATGAESRDCYLNMYAVKKPDKVDPNEKRLSQWTTCALSFEPLSHPCVVDRLGNVFNKAALVEGLLGKKLPREFGHIKGLRDMISIHLSPIPGIDAQSQSDHSGARFQCPITGLEFNGKYKFFALRGCGHVFSAKALKEVKSSACLVCHQGFAEADKIAINGSEEEVAVLRERMEGEKAKLRDKKTKKVKNGLISENDDVSLNLPTQICGTKHGIDDNKVLLKSTGMVDVNGKMGKGSGAAAAVAAKVTSSGSVKRFKAIDNAPANATKEVYASIFTSSRKSDFKETYSCRSLPLGRN